MSKQKNTIRLVDQPTPLQQSQLVQLARELVHILADQAFANYMGRMAANDDAYNVEESTQ